MVDRPLEVEREFHATGSDIAPDHLLKPRLPDRDVALFEHGNLARIDVETKHVVTHFGQAGA